MTERKRRGRQTRRGWGEEKKEIKRLNLVIFLICAFLVVLSIHAGVHPKQVYFEYILLFMVCRSIPSDSTRVVTLRDKSWNKHGTN